MSFKLTGSLRQYGEVKINKPRVNFNALSHTLDNPNPVYSTPGDEFGKVVAIRGNYAIVGVPYEDDATGVNSGKAYIFNVTTGDLVHTLDNPNAYGTSAGDEFGWSVAISDNYAVVGARFEADAVNGIENGKVYVFDVTTGALLRTISDPVGDSSRFGESIAIDGDHIIVGVYDDGSGLAYIIDVTTGALLHTLDNPNPDSNPVFDLFSYSVAINGNYAIVGAYGEDDVGGADSGKAYIFDVTTGLLVHTLDNPNPYSTSASDQFGYSVAISGDRAIVGAYGEDDVGGFNSGKAYIFNVTTGVLLFELNSPTFVNGDNFGWSVGIDGNLAVVGAYRAYGGGIEYDSGKAYIFDVTTGTLLYTLDNPNALGNAAGDNFGTSISISGNYAIVGAPVDRLVDGDQEGTSYIFDTTTGVLSHTLVNPDPYVGISSSYDYFGQSVAIDGDYAIVGAPEEDDAGGDENGKAYIFNVTTGALLHTLDDPNAYTGADGGDSGSDLFGQSVGISGNYAIVGAPDEDTTDGTGGTDYESGKAYIFDVTTGALLHTLDNPNAYDTSDSDRFGYSVAIGGNYAIVGAYGEDDVGGSRSGKAYIFNVTTGMLVHTLDNPNAYGTSSGDRFGWSVGISGDRAIVGAYREDDAIGTDNGTAYIFNVTTGALVYTLSNPNTTVVDAADDEYGYSVAISGDRAVVGAWQEDDATGTEYDSGKAYVFDVTTGALLYTLDNPNAYGTGGFDEFGTSVAISGSHVIVGAPKEDDAGGTDSGKAYVFDVSTGVLLHTLDNPNAYSTSAYDYFGNSVAISGDRAIVGAYSEADATGDGNGKTYIFGR